MAAKGTSSKELIINKLKEIFPDAFIVDGKELRIPLIEEGQEVQIKIALTCAKDNIPHGNSGERPISEIIDSKEPISISDAERIETKALLTRLGL